MRVKATPNPVRSTLKTQQPSTQSLDDEDLSAEVETKFLEKLELSPTKPENKQKDDNKNSTSIRTRSSRKKGAEKSSSKKELKTVKTGRIERKLRSKKPPPPPPLVENNVEEKIFKSTKTYTRTFNKSGNSEVISIGHIYGVKTTDGKGSSVMPAAKTSSTPTIFHVVPMRDPPNEDTSNKSSKNEANTLCNTLSNKGVPLSAGLKNEDQTVKKIIKITPIINTNKGDSNKISIAPVAHDKDPNKVSITPIVPDKVSIAPVVHLKQSPITFTPQMQSTNTTGTSKVLLPIKLPEALIQVLNKNKGTILNIPNMPNITLKPLSSLPITTGVPGTQMPNIKSPVKVSSTSVKDNQSSSIKKINVASIKNIENKSPDKIIKLVSEKKQEGSKYLKITPELQTSEDNSTVLRKSNRSKKQVNSSVNVAPSKELLVRDDSPKKRIKLEKRSKKSKSPVKIKLSVKSNSVKRNLRTKKKKPTRRNVKVSTPNNSDENVDSEDFKPNIDFFNNIVTGTSCANESYNEANDDFFYLNKNSTRNYSTQKPINVQKSTSTSPNVTTVCKSNLSIESQTLKPCKSISTVSNKFSTPMPSKLNTKLSHVPVSPIMKHQDDIKENAKKLRKRKRSKPLRLTDFVETKEDIKPSKISGKKKKPGKKTKTSVKAENLSINNEINALPKTPPKNLPIIKLPESIFKSSNKVIFLIPGKKSTPENNVFTSNQVVRPTIPVKNVSHSDQLPLKPVLKTYTARPEAENMPSPKSRKRKVSFDDSSLPMKHTSIAQKPAASISNINDVFTATSKNEVQSKTGQSVENKNDGHLKFSPRRSKSSKSYSHNEFWSEVETISKPNVSMKNNLNASVSPPPPTIVYNSVADASKIKDATNIVTFNANIKFDSSKGFKLPEYIHQAINRGEMNFIQVPKSKTTPSSPRTSRSPLKTSPPATNVSNNSPVKKTSPTPKKQTSSKKKVTYPVVEKTLLRTTSGLLIRKQQTKTTISKPIETIPKPNSETQTKRQLQQKKMSLKQNENAHELVEIDKKALAHRRKPPVVQMPKISPKKKEEKEFLFSAPKKKSTQRKSPRVTAGHPPNRLDSSFDSKAEAVNVKSCDNSFEITQPNLSDVEVIEKSEPTTSTPRRGRMKRDPSIILEIEYKKRERERQLQEQVSALKQPWTDFKVF